MRGARGGFEAQPVAVPASGATTSGATPSAPTRLTLDQIAAERRHEAAKAQREKIEARREGTAPPENRELGDAMSRR